MKVVAILQGSKGISGRFMNRVIRAQSVLKRFYSPVGLPSVRLKLSDLVGKLASKAKNITHKMGPKTSYEVGLITVYTTPLFWGVFY